MVMPENIEDQDEQDREQLLTPEAYIAGSIRAQMLSPEYSRVVAAGTRGVVSDHGVDPAANR